MAVEYTCDICGKSYQDKVMYHLNIKPVNEKSTLQYVRLDDPDMDICYRCGASIFTYIMSSKPTRLFKEYE